MVRRELEGALAIRHSGDVLLGGAPGAGGLLLNTKASQEAACSRAPAAIAPGQEPELHGAGVSRFVENVSHLAVAPVTDAAGVHVSGPGSSEFTKNGSHLEMTPVTDAAGVHVSGPGSSEFTKNGSHLEMTPVTDAAGVRVGGPGSSGNAENGSHLAGVDFSDEPWVVMWRRPPPHRTESGRLSYGTASPDSSVQKTALWCTRGSS